MRTLCDVCESAPAKLFCAADEAALCLKCDEKVHGCNKLASRHVRLQLAEARAVPRCDICESAPAFFFCGVDGTSLCLQCDMDVHTGGKKTHERYLMLGQRVELPTCKSQPEDGLIHMADGNDHHGNNKNNHYPPQKRAAITKSNNSDAPAVAIAVSDADNQSKSEHQAVSHLIDLNSNPLLHQQAGQATHTSKLRRSRDSTSSDDDECAGVVPQVANAQKKEAGSQKTEAGP